MQKTARSGKFEKTATSHYQRYSELDFQTHKIDKLLVTQASFNPSLRYKSLKTKLPTIGAYSSTTGIQGALHSHGKVGRLIENISDIRDDVSVMKEGLDVRLAKRRT
jgi:hypothetical protein